MKATVQTGYGGADVIRNVELEKPKPAADEVLIRVKAASLAAGDYFGMRGKPFVVRFWTGFPQPKKDFVVGLDLAGIVEAVGADITRFAPGDAVFGEGTRACAEYTCVKEERLAPKPPSLSFGEAAAVPVSALAALQGLRDVAKVQPGEHVLVNGASGGVGPFAVQIAKALGADVTGVCSTRNVEMVASIGADFVIDYTREDFTQGERRYDVIFDNVASHPFSEYRRVLTPEGRHIPSSGHAGMGYIMRASLRAPFIKQQAPTFVGKVNVDDLLTLTELIESGKVKPLIDRVYPLAQTADAFAYLDEGHARGKVVITVANDDE